jgi:hypothetical protein
MLVQILSQVHLLVFQILVQALVLNIAQTQVVTVLDHDVVLLLEVHVLGHPDLLVHQAHLLEEVVVDVEVLEEVVVDFLEKPWILLYT